MKIFKSSFCLISWVILITGCSSYKDEILLKQEEVLNSDRLCIGLKTNKACSEYVRSLKELTSQFEEHGTEIYKEAARGDAKSQKIVILAGDVTKVVEEIASTDTNK